MDRIIQASMARACEALYDIKKPQACIARGFVLFPCLDVLIY